jgi:hypothetical protein
LMKRRRPGIHAVIIAGEGVSEKAHGNRCKVWWYAPVELLSMYKSKNLIAFATGRSGLTKTILKTANVIDKTGRQKIAPRIDLCRGVRLSFRSSGKGMSKTE